MITDHRAHILTGQQISHYAADVVESGEMLLSLINDILDLAKLEAGKMEVSPTLSDSRRLLESCIRLMKPDAAKRSVSIHTDVRMPGTPAAAVAIKSTEPAVSQLACRVTNSAQGMATTGSWSWSTRWRIGQRAKIPGTTRNITTSVPSTPTAA